MSDKTKKRPKVSAGIVGIVSPGRPFIRGSDAIEQAKTANRVIRGISHQAAASLGNREAHGRQMDKYRAANSAFIEAMRDYGRKRKAQRETAAKAKKK